MLDISIAGDSVAPVSIDRAKEFVRLHLDEGMSKTKAYARAMGRDPLRSDGVTACKAWKHGNVQAVVAMRQHDFGIVESEVEVESEHREREWTRPDLLVRLRRLADDIMVPPQVRVTAIGMYAKYTGLDMPEKNAGNSYDSLIAALRSIPHQLS